MPPFTVLHVCMGNICRSPIAERLLVKAVTDRVEALVPAGGSAQDLLLSHSVRALPTQRTSGLTPAWSAANKAPVRPKPVAISSRISRIPCLCVTSRSNRM